MERKSTLKDCEKEMHKNDLGFFFSFWEEEGYPKHMGNTEQLKSFGEGVHKGKLYSMVCLLPGTEEGSIFSKEPVTQSCSQPSAGGQKHCKSHTQNCQTVTRCSVRITSTEMKIRPTDPPQACSA